MLAAAGLLDGRRAVTHRAQCAQLAADFPRLAVEPEPIFIEDRGVWTSAGVTIGMIWRRLWSSWMSAAPRRGSRPFMILPERAASFGARG